MSIVYFLRTCSNSFRQGSFWLFFKRASGVRGVFVRQAEQIIHTGVIVQSKRFQYFGGNIPFAGFVIGVADLRALQIRRKIFLEQVMIFPQVSDSFIHKNLCCSGIYKQKCGRVSFIARYYSSTMILSLA